MWLVHKAIISMFSKICYTTSNFRTYTDINDATDAFMTKVCTTSLLVLAVAANVKNTQ